jgi:hypothetical protein
MNDLAPIVSPFLMLVATYLSHKLRDMDKLPHGVNIALTLGSILVLFGLDYWLTADVTGDLKQNVVVGIGLLLSLISGGRELYVLWQILDDSPSPLVSQDAPPPVILTKKPQAATTDEPQPIILKDATGGQE